MDHEDTPSPIDEESSRRILRNILNNPMASLLRDHYEKGDPLEFYVRNGVTIIVIR